MAASGIVSPIGKKLPSKGRVAALAARAVRTAATNARLCKAVIVIARREMDKAMGTDLLRELFSLP